MYRNCDYNVEIDIQLGNGIYVFNSESSTGKTRLCKLLCEYNAYGEPVIGYTYNNFLSNIDLEPIVNTSKAKVIMLDRYDLYNGAFANLLLEYSKEAIVLIDCKHGLTFTDSDEWCDINISPNKIEVFQ